MVLNTINNSKSQTVPLRFLLRGGAVCTQATKKLTNVRDVKRYLNSVSIASDGLLVVKRTLPFAPVADAIVVP